MSHLACVALGIAATLVVVHLRDGRPTMNTAKAASTREMAGELPFAVEVPDTHEAPNEMHTTSRNVETSSLQPSLSPKDQRLVSEAAIYAASFQAGVFREEPMPEFAENYIYSGSDGAQWKELDRVYFEGLVDGWAADMERRLQTFFQEQPEMSKARVSVSCRETQCQVQVVEVAGEERLSGTLGTRLYHEPWYRENFHAVNSGGVTPSVGNVLYAKLVLPRRQQ